MMGCIKRILSLAMCVIAICFDSVAYAECAANEIDIISDGSQCETAKFTITTTNTTTTFLFRLSAAGIFYVDWGDGEIEFIDRTDNITLTDYSHNYDTAGAYAIRFAGDSTAYSENETTPVITFYKSSGGTQTNVATISGSLGALFPTLADGSRPRFYQTFRDFTGVPTSFRIPSNLFSGVSGAPLSYMFYQTFYGWINYNSCSIPANLFSGISGAPAPYMFYGTFESMGRGYGTEIIPSELFSGISGAPAPYMFARTFCANHAKGFGANLFSGINGAPAAGMYESTFANFRWASNPTIPSGFFGTFDGPPAANMFYCTFLNVFYLSGPIPENLFAGIVGPPAVGMFNSTFADAKALTTIPENLFAGISGPPVKNMFYQTFYGVSAKTIPENLFSGISGSMQSQSFVKTFYNCNKLTGFVSPKLFDGITGSASTGMSQIFSGTNSLVTTCPDGYSQYVTGFESAWNGKVSCYKCENDNELAYQNGCRTPCGVFKSFHVGDMVYPLFSDKAKIRNPTLNVKKDDTICYMFLESGNTNGLNIKMPNGDIYHLVDPTTPKYRCVNSDGVWDAESEMCTYDTEDETQ